MSAAQHADASGNSREVAGVRISGREGGREPRPKGRNGAGSSGCVAQHGGARESGGPAASCWGRLRDEWNSEDGEAGRAGHTRCNQGRRCDKAAYFRQIETRTVTKTRACAHVSVKLLDVGDKKSQ